MTNFYQLWKTFSCQTYLDIRLLIMLNLKYFEYYHQCLLSTQIDRELLKFSIFSHWIKKSVWIYEVILIHSFPIRMLQCLYSRWMPNTCKTLFRIMISLLLMEKYIYKSSKNFYITYKVIQVKTTHLDFSTLKWKC